MGRKNRRITKGRGSRIGSYAIASSIADPTSISCTTFNILAPIYKRLNQEDQSCRESDIRANWLNRNHRILDWLLYERSSIICLQEFWVGNEELVNMYERRLGDAGYMNFKLARTNNRGDGLLTAVHKDYFRVLNHRELLFNDFGDRVAQLLHVELVSPLSQCRSSNVRQEILIVNTHLLFPHDSSLCLVRLNQVYKILQYVESYQKENKLNPLPIILCGDWNGSKRGHVYKFLRSQGFVSSYDTAHQYKDADAQKWVSHRNHRGNICGVDFIWLLNPNRYRKLLKTSWTEAVFGMFKYLLRRASLTADDAFAFLKADSLGDYITYSGFCEALRQLNLLGHCHGLSVEETKELWVQADIDGNGVLDYKEFQQRIWNPTWSEQIGEICYEVWDDVDNTEQTIGFSIKNAVLFPTEVEKGMWPEDYSLSDHARLTVVFSPVGMPCPSLIS
ncbi:EF-Hand 1, calcium-binding site protein [Actinidia chinensis var. chinensis]|uniref:EF-Hand 1, calcium-binding site protein n=1 Tax=Actinidia chinensis var. chinensis TaxID=1590841 RepID=A0A2R6RSF6_ACTCC|nr:EF-Hand 1, calcium-binding site protein [Actinidia chinensis var. chinensis]